MKNIFTFLLTIFVSANLFAQYNINFGPYLQHVTSTGIKVKWKTNLPHASKVMYGSDLSTLNLTAEDNTGTTNHTVQISGLQPKSKYFYAIYDGSTLIEGADSSHWFTTFPADNDTGAVRIWALGDFGKGNSYQAQVRDAALNYFAADGKLPGPWIWLGDNVYDDGLDQEYRDKVFDSVYGYKNLFTYMPFQPAPGNHDYNSISPVTNSEPPLQHAGAYYDIVDVYKNGEAGGVPSGHELYYSFDYGNVHLISFNSELGSLFNQSEDWIGIYLLGSFNTSPMKDWLINDLQTNTKPWVVVYFHQPPHTAGSHESGSFWEVYMKAMRENFIPIMEQYGVDLVINGHSHVYERSYLVKGLHGDVNTFTPNMIMNGTSGRIADGEPYTKYLQGNDPNAGTVYIVCGNGGSKDDNPAFDHPYMFSEYGCDTCVGSLVLDVKGNRLDGRHITGTGEVFDHFTIFKQDSAPPFNGINELAFAKNISVNPNPFSNVTELTFEMDKAEMVNITLTDLQGREYKVMNTTLQAGAHKVAINANELNLAKGSYVVNLTSGKETVSKVVFKVE